MIKQYTNVLTGGDNVRNGSFTFVITKNSLYSIID